MLPIILNKKQTFIKLCKKYDIKTMYVFGSATTENFNELSDIDILITFNEISISKLQTTFLNSTKSLEKLFDRKVDLLTVRSLTNPVFIKCVEATKQLLYAA